MIYSKDSLLYRIQEAIKGTLAHNWIPTHCHLNFIDYMEFNIIHNSFTEFQVLMENGRIVTLKIIPAFEKEKSHIFRRHSSRDWVTIVYI